MATSELIVKAVITFMYVNLSAAQRNPYSVWITLPCMDYILVSENWV